MMVANLTTRFESQSSTVLGIFRIVVGFLYAIHGTVHLFSWPIAPGGGPVPVGSWPIWWAGLIELIVGLLVMIGLFTRPAALLGSGAMAYAYFTVHQPKALWPIDNGGELAVLYCFALLLLAFTGAGAFAVDGRRRN
jgi:putative oxidoreductase